MSLQPPRLSEVAAKTSWADDLDEEEFPPPSETFDPETGIKTLVEYKYNAQDRKVKVTRLIKRTLLISQVSHIEAERKLIPKFGAERGKKPGPDFGTTRLGEAIKVKLSIGGHKEVKEPEVKQAAGPKSIKCRTCQGNHYTAACPYKETLGGVLGQDAADAEIPEGPPPSVQQPPSANNTGKYIPIHQREGRKLVGETMNRPNRDDLPTLRVTNLSEDANEDDLWELFNRFGSISRIYVGKDQETGLCKGFAFVSFEDKKEAENAMKKINGLPYDHLILGCAWSLPRGEREMRDR